MTSKNKSSVLAEFDYVIVGAGSAGCVLANRLSADGRYSICILEAGGSDRKFWIQTPLGYGKTFADEKLNWMYTAQPSAGLNGRGSYWPRGKVLGGSSSINAMVYIRGQPEDYNEWAAQGNHGWGWNDVLPYFKKSEHYSKGANEYRGGSGQLYVQDASRHYHPICRRFIAAAGELGLAEIDDFNAADLEGVGMYQIAAKHGRRMSAARAYLRPALMRRNLTLFKNALASKLLFDGHCATGVGFAQQGVLHSVAAKREVIVAAGTVNSPQLLQLSGVGAVSELSGLGIEPVLDNPNVGQHLQDHLAISHYYHATEPTLNNQLRPWWGKLFAGMQYLALRRGPLAIGVNQAGGFFRSSAACARPNLQLYFSPLTYATNSSDGERPIQPDAYPGFLTSISQCRPLSRGHIAIHSSDPHAAPL
ncbi:MAG: GMC family oxidoreductase, partial [Pseudomonadales bacterium]